jgi:SAM-dependent methyltransferase
MEFTELAAMAGAHAEARALQVALKLGIFELLVQQASQAANEIAASLGTDRRATMLLANAMVALGLLDKHEDNYRLSSTAYRYLVKSSPEYLGGMILFDEAIFPYWVTLEDSVRSGTSARSPDMFQSAPEDTERFIRAMDSLTRARGDAAWVAEHLDLAGIRTVADLGGGPGTYLAAIVQRHQKVRGAVWDLPATLKVTRRILAEREPQIMARIELLEVDYLKAPLPGPVDAVFMSNIVHSEQERDNASLMAKCFDAIAPGGLIALKDHVMNGDLTDPRAGAIFSLYLLLMTRGRDYSFDEIAGWLSAAGFIDTKMHRLPNPPFTSSLVTARRP